jgi:agmatine deiminase
MLLESETPRAAGFAMPAEWAPHERTLMAWPVRLDLWNESLAQARADYAQIAQAIAAFEPVLMVAPPGAGAEVTDRCGAGVEVVELPIDDSWLRDNGPIGVTDGSGGRAAVDFGFNAWGGKFPPWDADAALSEALLDRLGIDRFAAPIVLEGGSIAVDGEGTLIATEQCLLHPTRNPDLERSDIERVLHDYLGIETFVWLPNGLLEDHDTDGHVDNVAAFVRPGVVIAQTAPDGPNHELMSANLDVLRSARDARGRELEVIEIDVLPTTAVRGDVGVAPYVNFYVCNGAVIVPVCGDDLDRDAETVARIGALYGREGVAVPGATLAEGGGGVHCITQQVPAP